MEMVWMDEVNEAATKDPPFEDINTFKNIMELNNRFSFIYIFYPCTLSKYL